MTREEPSRVPRGSRIARPAGPSHLPDLSPTEKLSVPPRGSLVDGLDVPPLQAALGLPVTVCVLPAGAPGQPLKS